MVAEVVDELYFTYEGRLASFQKSNKKRKSTTTGRGGKPLNWPHKQIAPASLAKAGFFFNPFPENPDNVTCFLCQKGLDGWEDDDDPLLEHLKHAPSCGWAIVAAIEAEVGEHGKEDPNLPHMIEARKATFAGRWPHEGKRGWKCKTKQLVDAGWKYTPTSESDDNASCAYCQLALDAWEPNDKPLDEHYKRAPACPFFALIGQSQIVPKKTRGKAGRGSKASRLSVQSVATALSETTTVADMTVGFDDTALTTASTMTQSGKKGRKKAAAGKGRKTKAKKAEPVQDDDTRIQEDEDTALAAPAPKPTRGKKRGSDAMDDSVATVSEAPAPKKRATRARASTAVESSVVEPPEDTEMADVPAPKKTVGRKKGRPSKTKSTRKDSMASIASNVSLATLNMPPGSFPDDDEIERQLEADLERPLTDDEEITADSDSERRKSRTKKTKAQNACTDGSLLGQKPSNYTMFDPAPAESEDAAVEDELRALEAEMQTNSPDQLQVPKKGRKAGTRKASKQTKPKKITEVSLPPDEETPEQQLENEMLVEQDASLGSTDTVINKTRTSQAEKPKRGKGRPPKASTASQDSADVMELVGESIEQPAEPPAKRSRGRPPQKTKDTQKPKLALSQRSADTANDEVDLDADELSAPAEAPIKAPVTKGRTLAPPRAAVSRAAAHPPSTPAKVISPAPSARQPALSPSPSPQSSDAENQPPSSQPAASAGAKRVALAPAVATPARGSPSRRNVLAGLQSTTPWTAMDIDAVLGSPRGAAEKENAVERLLRQGKELASPEKRMTVEEWVYFNAGEADKMLKRECEAMVSRFESQGTQAMNVLEGLIVE